MLRQVLTPSKENPTISIPPEFYGKKVEILVYPFNTNSENIDNIFDKYLYSFNNYKFDRNEANDYE
jgi:hypothetical protein